MEEKPKNTFYLDPDYTNFIPRKTRLKYSTLGINFGVTMLFLLLGSFYGILFFIFVSSAFTIAHDHWQFSIKGLETRASVTTCESQPDSEQPRILYTYTVEDEVYNAQYNVEKRHARCVEFPLSTQISIQYHVANPSHSRVILPDSDNVPALVFACLIPFCLLGTIFAVLVIIATIKARYQYYLLRRDGIVLDGEVVKAEYEYQERQGRYGGYYLLNIMVEFETPDAQLLTRNFHGESEFFISRVVPQAGSPVKLLYANDNAVIML